jgi:uncharacterized paraquat-inducible protein A
MSASEKEVQCACGHTYMSALKVNWCPKCGQRIYDSEKDKRMAKVNAYYLYGVVLVIISALAYFFAELIIIPILSM